MRHFVARARNSHLVPGLILPLFYTVKSPEKNVPAHLDRNVKGMDPSFTVPHTQTLSGGPEKPFSVICNTSCNFQVNCQVARS